MNERSQSNTCEISNNPPTEKQEAQALRYLKKRLNLNLLREKDLDFYIRIKNHPTDYQKIIKILIAESSSEQNLNKIYEGTFFEGYANPQYILIKKFSPLMNQPWRIITAKQAPSRPLSHSPLCHHFLDKAYFLNKVTTENPSRQKLVDKFELLNKNRQIKIIELKKLNTEYCTLLISQKYGIKTIEDKINKKTKEIKKTKQQLKNIHHEIQIIDQPTIDKIKNRKNNDSLWKIKALKRKNIKLKELSINQSFLSPLLKKD